MELNKCIIEHSSHSETAYCINSKVVHHKKYVLLGFKDSIPVVCNTQDNTMPEEKTNAQSITKNKVLKIEVDPHTGDKFINLNGRKIKISPAKPITTNKEQNNSQKIPSIVPQPVKFKIIKEIPLLKSQQYTSIKLEKANVDLAHISEQIINKKSLSQKTLITSELQSVKFSDSSNMTLKPLTVDKAPQTNMSETAVCGYSPENIAFASNKISKGEQHMEALDLTNHSSKTDHIQDGKSTSNKSCQTDESWSVISKDKVVDSGVQTEESSLGFEDLDCIDLESILKEISSPMSPHLPSKKIIDPLYTPSDSLLELPLPIPEKSLPVGEPNHTANNFYKELRTALVPDDRGNMPIHIGVLCNNLKTVKKCWLILKILQQSVDLPNNSDFSPLQLATINSVSCDIIDYLLSKGASLAAIDVDGNNVLHLAVEYNRTDALSLILQHAREQDFNLDQPNHEGLTPLMISCLNGQQECARLLLDFKADVNARDLISGRTSLFHAAENHDVEMVQLLLSYHADTKLKNFFGTSPHDAMYEIDDMPEQIKTLILARNGKRKNAEETRPASKARRRDEPAAGKAGLKTYPKYRKIVFPEVSRRFSVVKEIS